MLLSRLSEKLLQIQFEMLKTKTLSYYCLLGNLNFDMKLPIASENAFSGIPFKPKIIKVTIISATTIPKINNNRSSSIIHFPRQFF